MKATTKRPRAALIADGVESRTEADVLRRLGVEFGQGYLFGLPKRPA